MQVRLSEVAKQKAWLEHYKRLPLWHLIETMNIYLINHTLKDHQSQSPFTYSKMKSSKAAGLSGVVV